MVLLQKLNKAMSKRDKRVNKKSPRAGMVLLIGNIDSAISDIDSIGAGRPEFNIGKEIGVINCDGLMTFFCVHGRTLAGKLINVNNFRARGTAAV